MLPFIRPREETPVDPRTIELLSEISKRLQRVETRLVCLMAAHGLDRNGKTQEEGGS